VPVSPPLLLYAEKSGILDAEPAPLKGLSNDDEACASDVALRVCMAADEARATGSWCAVHVRAIARVVLARAGIVGGVAGW
jgi:hypothetical protein